MPLSVPLGPEDSNRYTVHVERVRWDAAELAQHGSASVEALTSTAREELRSSFHCFAATLLEADVSVTEHADGAAEAVARVLCDSDICAAAAQPYESKLDEEAEAARNVPFVPLIYYLTALGLHRNETGLP